MEHVKRLVLVPEHMVDQRKKPLVPPLTAQVQEIDSDMQDIMQRQDIPIDAQAKVYDQNLHLDMLAFNAFISCSREG